MWSVNLPRNKYLGFRIPLRNSVIKRHDNLKRFCKINVSLVFWIGTRLWNTTQEHNCCCFDQSKQYKLTPRLWLFWVAQILRIIKCHKKCDQSHLKIPNLLHQFLHHFLTHFPLCYSPSLSSSSSFPFSQYWTFSELLVHLALA